MSVASAHRGRGRLPRSGWHKIGVAFALAAVVAATVPHAFGGGDTPPVRGLVVSGFLIALVTAVALNAAIRRDLGLPARVGAFAVGYNVLVVAVKFVLAPKGLYEVNQKRELSALIPLDDWLGALLVAACIFGLYGGALFLLYRHFRNRLRRLPELQPPERRRQGRKLVLPVVVAVVALAGTGGIVVILLPLALFSGAGEYLSFVFSSSVSLLIALALTAACAVAGLALKETADQAEVVGDAALLVSFFWVGLYFLALYHVLWVVYVLALTSIWPLRVVVPK